MNNIFQNKVDPLQKLIPMLRPSNNVDRFLPVLINVSVTIKNQFINQNQQ